MPVVAAVPWMIARSNSSARPGAPVEAPRSGATAGDFGSFLDEPCFIERARALCRARAQITQTRIRQQGQTGRLFGGDFRLQHPSDRFQRVRVKHQFTVEIADGQPNRAHLAHARFVRTA